MHQELGATVALVLDGGPCQVGIESTIIDLSCHGDQPPRLLRPGHITPEQIYAVTGVRPEWPAEMLGENVPRVSGSLEAHYAPLTPMYLVASEQLPAVIAELQKSGRRCALLARTRQTLPVLTHAQSQLPDEAEAYAHGLYAALRELDRSANDVIVVEEVPADPAWAAVADRLRRAACGSGEV